MTTALALAEPTIHQAEAIGDRIIRRTFQPPYANPPISNYRKFWYSNSAAFWASFRVFPGDGGTVNQLGTRPVTSVQTAFQEVGFGYTFKAALTTDYWFDVEAVTGPNSMNGAQNSIELELRGSNVAPVVVPITSRSMNVNATLAAYLEEGVQYTLLFKSKVVIIVSPGQSKYGEVIASFRKLVVNYIQPGIGPIGPETVQVESIDLEQALQALQADGKDGEILLQPVSFEDIAKAGPTGFGGFSGK